MSENTIIQSDHIGLRDTFESDLDLIKKMEGGEDNTPFIRQWPMEQHRRAIADDNIAHLTVQSIGEGDTVGYIILIGLKNPDRSIEFKRIVINEKGRGYGREAVKLIKSLAFEKYDAHRLWLEVVEGNDRAYNLYKSEGFVVEGVHRESMKQGDSFKSLIVMSMLEREYYGSR